MDIPERDIVTPLTYGELSDMMPKKYAFMGVRNPIASTRAELNNSDFKKSITRKIIAKLK